jgi:hypothetical protein
LELNVSKHRGYHGSNMREHPDITIVERFSFGSDCNNISQSFLPKFQWLGIPEQ